MHRHFSHRVLVSVAASAVLLFWGTPSRAGDWPQFRGPGHDGSTTEEVNTQWPAGGPKILWKAPLGSSLGSFITGDKKLFDFEMHGENEACVARDPATGRAIWLRDVDKTIHDRDGGDGPRSTPAYSDGKVYVLSTYEKLACLSAADGRVIWAHDLKAELGGKEPHWGSAASPLVDGDWVFVCAGGAGRSLVAFEKKTGKIVWKHANDKPTHASPVAVTLLGVRQIIFLTQSGLVAVKPESGDVLWRQAFPFSTSTAASAVACGSDVVYCSAGYGVGAGAYKISKEGDAFRSAEIWRKPGEDINHWSTPVYKDGFLYGLYGFKQFRTEPLKCIDVKTGEEKWSKSGFGQGQVILVDGKLLVQGDQGELALADASPEGYHEIGRCHPIAGKCWIDPIVANGHIYIRSQVLGACLDVRTKQ